MCSGEGDMRRVEGESDVETHFGREEEGAVREGSAVVKEEDTYDTA
jgi:hypothetical protein